MTTTDHPNELDIVEAIVVGPDDRLILRVAQSLADTSPDELERWAEQLDDRFGECRWLVIAADGPDVELVTGAIDVAHLERQREWSARTFGPGARTAGVIDHITKELDEVAADPADVLEWADLLILAFDGALRAGHEPAAIIAAIKAKQSVNEG